MRALARRLGMSVSFLSRITSGQRQLTASVAARLANTLNLSPEEEAHLMRLVATQRLSSQPEVSRTILTKISKASRARRKTVEGMSFDTIAQWQHFAIISLLRLRDFKPSANWIGRKLGLPPAVAKESLERLIHVGLLERSAGGLSAMNGGEIETPVDVPSRAVRENHRQHLALAENALNELSMELREFLNCTVCLNRSDIPKAKKRIRHFIDGFMKDLERPTGEDLFQLNVQFHLLTKS